MQRHTTILSCNAKIFITLYFCFGLNAYASTDELSAQEKQIGEKFEYGAKVDPEGHQHMLTFSDPNFFKRTQHLEKVWGSAKILDGQTLEISGRKIRLFGIKAPDISQVCKGPKDLQFDAGAFALSRLKTIAPPSKAVVCFLEPNKDDAGTCFVWGFFGPINIAKHLVREGAAWAHPNESNIYVRDEGWVEGTVSRDEDPTMLNLWHTDCDAPD